MCPCAAVVADAKMSVTTVRIESQRVELITRADVTSLFRALRRFPRRLRCRHAGDRDAVGRAAHVVEARHVEEANRLRVSAVLAAYAELQVRLRLAARPGAEPHQPADAGLVDRLERAAVHDLRLDIAVEKAPLHIVAREAERRLGEVVGAEREEV